MFCIHLALTSIVVTRIASAITASKPDPQINMSEARYSSLIVVLQHAIYFLKFNDAYKFLRICKNFIDHQTYHFILNDIFRRDMNALFQAKGLPSSFTVNKLFAGCTSREIVIAGSMPLQVLTGSNWATSDCDVYVTRKHVGLGRRNLRAMGFKRIHTGTYAYLTYPGAFKVERYWYKVDKTHKFMLDLVICKQSVKDFICQFDIVACMTQLDANAVIIPDDPTGYACPFEQRSWIPPNAIGSIDPSRIVKYQDRGVMLYCNPRQQLMGSSGHIPLSFVEIKVI